MRKEIAERKQREIEEKIEKARQEEEARKKLILEKQFALKMRQDEMEKEKEIELKIKKEQQEEKQRQRDIAREKQVFLEEEKKAEIIKKREESEIVRNE